MKYLVTFHDETCLCIDEAMLDADTPGELHKKCEEYVRTNLRDYSVAGSKYYKYLECSTKGDKRYSAFCAQITINGKTDSIEHFYLHSAALNCRWSPHQLPLETAVCTFIKLLNV